MDLYSAFALPSDQNLLIALKTENAMLAVRSKKKYSTRKLNLLFGAVFIACAVMVCLSSLIKTCNKNLCRVS